MPILQATTKASQSVWKSPDGQREIIGVVLDVQGQPFKAKTYSKDIARVGWSGEVETYEKQGRNGTETFVKQPPKEGGFQPQQGSRQSGYGASGSKTSFDNFTMYLSYAKDLAIASVFDGKYNSELFATLMEEVAAGGKHLFESRPDGSKPEGVEPSAADISATFPDAQNYVVEGEEVLDPWAI